MHLRAGFRDIFRCVASGQQPRAVLSTFDEKAILKCKPQVMTNSVGYCSVVYKCVCYDITMI